MGTPDFAVPALKALHAAKHDIVAVYSQPNLVAEAAKNLPPVLAITEQGTYRCADNTIVKVDFLGAKEAASITVGTDTPVRVDAPKDADGKIVADRAMKSADGATVLAGGGDAINLTLAGKGAQSCKK